MSYFFSFVSKLSIFSLLSLFLTSNCFALNQLEDVIRTKQLVKEKLWNEGVKATEEVAIKNPHKFPTVSLPEEIKIPLNKLDS